MECDKYAIQMSGGDLWARGSRYAAGRDVLFETIEEAKKTLKRCGGIRVVKVTLEAVE